MNSINDIRDHDVCRMWHIQGMSQRILTKLCEKLHEIATCLTRRRDATYTYRNKYYHIREHQDFERNK